MTTHLTKTEASIIYADSSFNKFEGSVISQLLRCPQHEVIPYVKNGLYDCVAHIFKQTRFDNIDLNNSNWVRLKDNVLHNVLLAKPTGKPTANFININNMSSCGFLSVNYKSYFQIDNVARLSLMVYHSKTYNYQAITFGDSKNILKPLKIIDHDWKRISGCYIHGAVGSIFECSKCGIKGASKAEKGLQIIVPQQFVSCDEYTIMDILE